MRVSTAIDRLHELDYPATADDVVDDFGGEHLEFPAGSEDPRAVLQRIDAGDFACPDDACLALLSALGPDAVGRRRYSDRDPPLCCEDGPAPVSF